MTKAGTSSQQIAQARRDLTYIARFIQPTIETLDLLADPLNGTDYDKAGGGTGISDPTPGQVDKHARWIGLRADVVGISAQIGTLSRMLVAAMIQVPVTDDERRKREVTCSGGLDRVDYEGWERHCESYYDRRTGENAFLCSACIRRKNRHRDDLAKLNAA